MKIPGLLEPLANRRHMVLYTRKRDGSWVSTPVHPVVEDDHVFFRTWRQSGKAKRLRNFPEVRFAPSTARGRPTGATLTGRATLLHDDTDRHAASLINRRFPFLQGIDVRLIHWIMRYGTQHYEIDHIQA